MKQGLEKLHFQWNNCR